MCSQQDRTGGNLLSRGWPVTGYTDLGGVGGQAGHEGVRLRETASLGAGQLLATQMWEMGGAEWGQACDEGLRRGRRSLVPEHGENLGGDDRGACRVCG